MQDNFFWHSEHFSRYMPRVWKVDKFRYGYSVESMHDLSQFKYSKLIPLSYFWYSSTCYGCICVFTNKSKQTGKLQISTASWKTTFILLNLEHRFEDSNESFWHNIH
jgi:hypothetical protein